MKMDDFFSIQMQLMRLRRTIDLRIEPHPIWEGDFNIQNPTKLKRLALNYKLTPFKSPTKNSYPGIPEICLCTDR